MAQTWTADLPAIAAATLLLAWYLAAVRRARHSGITWPVGRTLACVAGLAVVLAATCSPIGAGARSTLTDYVLQMCLLLLVAPLLLGAARPFALLRHGFAPFGGDERVGNGPRATRRITAVGPLLLVVVTSVVVFATPVTVWSVQSDLGYQTLHLALLAVGLAVAAPLTDAASQLSSATYAALLGLGFLEFLLDAVPGIVLRLAAQPTAATAWFAYHRGGGWTGLTPLADQHTAGAWLWFFAEVGDVPFLALLIAAWVRADTRDARRIDAVLNSDTVPDGEAAQDGATTRNAPWWQTDPSVFGEARARRNGWTNP